MAFEIISSEPRRNYSRQNKGRNKQKSWRNFHADKPLPNRELRFKIRELNYSVSGCYVFYNSEDEPLYVGQSRALRSRLYAHLQTTIFMNEVERIEIYESNKRELAEMYLIGSLKPKYNKRKAYFKKIATLESTY